MGAETFLLDVLGGNVAPGQGARLQKVALAGGFRSCSIGDGHGGIGRQARQSSHEDVLPVEPR